MQKVFGVETDITKQSVMAVLTWRSMTADERRVRSHCDLLYEGAFDDNFPQPFLDQAAQEELAFEAARRAYWGIIKKDGTGAGYYHVP